MRTILSLLLLYVSLSFFSCHNQEKNQQIVAKQYEVYCGSCHLLPDPKNIPKDIWKNDVLPEMAARMGYRYNEYNPFLYKSPEEITYMERINIYPEKAILDSNSWWKLHDYIISLAPDSIPIEKTRQSRNKKLTQFSERVVDFPKLREPIITGILFDTVSQLFTIGDAMGNLYQWPASTESMAAKKRNSAMTAYRQKQNDQYITEVGVLNPSEVPKGLLIKISAGVTDTLASQLHRPVHTEINDLNQDGTDEILICEFGNNSGQLSLLEYKEGSYHKKSLYALPGSTKFEIVDMDGDGQKDIVTLFGQGNEGIFILYQKENLDFAVEQVIQLSPEFGSSWFEILDYDKDGDLDLVLTNGDNADYSIFLKPYHGIRLYVNDGTNTFNETWFYPLYGASRVLAEDFDLDGDIDFAVTALFNDSQNAPEEGFIYLENLNSMQFEFQAYTLKGDFTNGWLTMEKGDYDADGDQDIMLGTFKVQGVRKKSSYFGAAKIDPTKLLFLENKRNQGKRVE